MKIKITKSAYNDIVVAQNFYKTQKPGLGEYFQNSIFADIDSLNIYAGIHKVQQGHYRLLSKKFPYAIYYKIVDNAIIVTAILDCRRNPLWIKKKLKKWK